MDPRGESSYGLAAYVILPNVVRMGLKVLHRRLIPSYTVTGDGLPGDPVNLVLIGTLQQLCDAFATAGWSTADRLGVASSWRMIRSFLLNAPYPTAPFSTLYLFGRRQDIGFQEPIDNSPRKRSIGAPGPVAGVGLVGVVVGRWGDIYLLSRPLSSLMRWSRSAFVSESVACVTWNVGQVSENPVSLVGSG